ncbi:MAG: YraN family protein [Rothia sp. (in: high G+C Gram-positive bacteria)]|nr:YraN family protein [Rothia sp. (in: high G+C Gram-positive bacteria)]
MSQNLELGRWGEDLALAVLQAQGYQLLQRNWRPKSQDLGHRLTGEIDAILLDPAAQQLVFLEVKTRSSQAYGHPLEAIAPAKAQRLRSLAYAWINQQGQRQASLRIDAVAITGSAASFSWEHLLAVA